MMDFFCLCTDNGYPSGTVGEKASDDRLEMPSSLSDFEDSELGPQSNDE